MKGIILTGGDATRLHPLTAAIAKELLPVYDKPLIYYPLSTLMLGGVREVLVVATRTDLPLFRRVLGNGSEWGLSITYTARARPAWVADVFRHSTDFIGDQAVALILGDNIFYGKGLSEVLARARSRVDRCTVFGYPVTEPHRYGVARAGAGGRLVAIDDGPCGPAPAQAVTGLYVYPNDVVDIVRSLPPSPRGELGITDVTRAYVRQGRATLESLGRGFAWLDAGTHDGLLNAAQLVQVVEHRQGVRIACLEEMAFRMGFIDAHACHALGVKQRHSEYGRYVIEVSGITD